MLKFLTSKFRNQSLNEVRPYEPQGFLRHESDIEGMERYEDEDEELRNLNLEGTVPLNNNNQTELEEPNLNSKPILSNLKESPFLDQENQPPITLNEGNKLLGDNTLAFCPIDIPNSTDDYSSLQSEKRKWSQVNCKRFLSQMGSGADSSSDDEIKELCYNKSSSGFLSSSPPGKVTVLSKHSAFCAQIRPTDGHSRKKHRLIICDERPSLNFEKMQQKTLLKKYPHSISRPRAIRIRNMSQPSMRHGYEHAMLTFKPIALNPSFSLAPVEEPGFVF